MSMDEFLLCFSRFCSVRGQPSVVYSDNGKNFSAAETELKSEFDILKSQESAMKTFLNCNTIDWHFSPPDGSHFGGVWERLVKSCKIAMKVILKNRLVNDQILARIFLKMEFC